MARTFKSNVKLEKAMESACNKAVEKTCNRLLGKLQELIDSEYYDVFEPDYYKRTYQFWKSAVTRMLSKNCGEIYMNANAMNYNSFWSGEKQLINASVGSHGGWTSNKTKKHRFWNAFINYCRKNALKILKEELKNAGLPVK